MKKDSKRKKENRNLGDNEKKTVKKIQERSKESYA